MRRSAHIVAVCGLTAALSIVLMTLGSMFGVMTYACPLIVGVLMLCVRQELGTRWALTLWVAIGLLSLMLVPEKEMALVFIGIFGWYPAVKPALDKLPKWLGWAAKLLLLNGASILIYAILIMVIGLQDMPAGVWGWLSLAAMGNVIYVCNDKMLDKLKYTFVPRIQRLFSGR